MMLQLLFLKVHLNLQCLDFSRGNLPWLKSPNRWGNPGIAGGGVIRESNGDFVLGFSFHLGIATNNRAEISAFYNGLLICYQLGWTNVMIETDSMLISEWWRKKQEVYMEFQNMWCDICEFMTFVGDDIDHFIEREIRLLIYWLRMGRKKGILFTITK